MSTQPTPSPGRSLTATEQMHRHTYLTLRKLFHSGPEKRDEMMTIAYENYMNPTIPITLRAACCKLLASGDGDYLTYAKECVQLTKLMLTSAPHSKQAPGLVKEAEEALQACREDYEAEYGKAALEQRDADAAAATAAPATKWTAGGENAIRVDPQGHGQNYQTARRTEVKWEADN